MKTQDEYNEWFKVMLNRHFEANRYELKEKSHDGINYLYAKFPHPSDNEKDIGISTYDKELTLFIWLHHEHHDSFEDCDHEQEFNDLCDFIEDIINDKVLFSAGYKNNQVVYVSRNNEINELEDNDVDRIEVKSWSGELDRVIGNNNPLS